MAAYLASLERIRKRRISRLCPGHGDVIDDPKAALTDYVEHRLQREAQILDALREGPSKITDIVARIYVDVPEALHPIARFSVHAHLLKLADEGRVEGAELDGKWEIPVGKRR